MKKSLEKNDLYLKHDSKECFTQEKEWVRILEMNSSKWIQKSKLMKLNIEKLFKNTVEKCTYWEGMRQKFKHMEQRSRPCKPYLIAEEKHNWEDGKYK